MTVVNISGVVFKADSHAALTAHVLHNETISPTSPVSVPNPSAANSASSPEINTLFTHAVEVEISPNIDTPNQEDSEDAEHPICFDCGRHFWSQEVAHIHALIAHMHDTGIVRSSAPDRSPTFLLSVLRLLLYLQLPILAYIEAPHTGILLLAPLLLMPMEV